MVPIYSVLGFALCLIAIAHAGDPEADMRTVRKQDTYQYLLHHYMKALIFKNRILFFIEIGNRMVPGQYM
jgi:hypothetical protein